MDEARSHLLTLFGVDFDRGATARIHNAHKLMAVANILLREFLATD